MSKGSLLLETLKIKTKPIYLFTEADNMMFFPMFRPEINLQHLFRCVVIPTSRGMGALIYFNGHEPGRRYS